MGSSEARLIGHEDHDALAWKTRVAQATPARTEDAIPSAHAAFLTSVAPDPSSVASTAVAAAPSLTTTATRAHDRPRLFYDGSNQRPARGGDELLGLPQAARRARCEDDRNDVRRAHAQASA